VIKVNWGDAVAYTHWLAKQTGQAYRLPSESEWEYAARSGSQTKYSWGNEMGGNNANCDTGCGDEFKTTAPVASFNPNAFGLYDVHGNVWEWVQDCWNKSYKGGPEGGSAWESGDCSRRVLRGGSWGIKPGDLRSANRVGIYTSSRNNDSGFRLARTL